MKYVKMLAAVTAMALMAFVGAGTASATTLTGEGGAVLGTGSSFHAELEPSEFPKSKLTTAFKTFECDSSTIAGKSKNVTSTAIDIVVESLAFGGCNCEVSVIGKGTISITWTEGSNGTVSWNGTETTLNCSTIFGSVHCIYVTEKTDIGTLTGSESTTATALLDVSGANIPRLPTSGLCAEGAKWDAVYKITSPDVLNVKN